MFSKRRVKDCNLVHHIQNQPINTCKIFFNTNAHILIKSMKHKLSHDNKIWMDGLLQCKMYNYRNVYILC